MERRLSSTQVCPELLFLLQFLAAEHTFKISVFFIFSHYSKSEMRRTRRMRKRRKVCEEALRAMLFIQVCMGGAGCEAPYMSRMQGQGRNAEVQEALWRVTHFFLLSYTLSHSLALTFTHTHTVRKRGGG